VTAWDEYQLARHPGRPTPRYYVQTFCEDFFELHGDRTGSDDPAAFICLARFQQRAIAIAAFNRASPSAAGFRKVTRLIELAGRLELPLVTLVDCPGADTSFDSEYAGLASAISGTFEALLTVESPVVCIVTGEGGSGGAMALSCGDVVAIQEHAVFSVIAPEGAAEILHRDAGRAAEVADTLRPTSDDLLDLGLADFVLPEPKGGAHTDPAEAGRTIATWLATTLARVKASPESRAARFSSRN
jgi:acetyl-CoA carboxylase carboxyl transferase subunit alpha